LGRHRPTARVAKVLTVLGIATPLGATGLSQPARACSTVVNWEEGPVLGARSAAGGLIPRNAAFLWKGTQPPASELALAYEPSTQMRIMGHVVRRILQRTPDSGATPTSLFIAKPDELLPRNGYITISDARTTASYTVGEHVDDVPPETPRVTSGAIEHVDGSSGCGKEEDSCGSGPWTYLQFTIAEHASDDHTPAASATYAVYLERSAAEARAATTPFRLLRAPLLLSDGSLSQIIPSLGDDWAGGDALVARRARGAIGPATKSRDHMNVATDAHRFGGIRLLFCFSVDPRVPSTSPGITSMASMVPAGGC
jgi:hypothetical protein